MTAPKKRFLEFYSVTYSKQPQQQSRLDKNSLKPPKNSLKENPPLHHNWRKSLKKICSCYTFKEHSKVLHKNSKEHNWKQNTATELLPLVLLFFFSAFLVLSLFFSCSCSSSYQMNIIRTIAVNLRTTHIWFGSWRWCWASPPWIHEDVWRMMLLSCFEP